MKHWKLLAEGYGLAIPAGDLDRISPVLDALEESFRPLAASIPWDIEPAVIFSLAEEDQ